MDRDFPEVLSDDDIRVLNLLASLPNRDPLAFMKNMRTTLTRALSCAKDMEVTLYDGEIRHWINGTDDFIYYYESTESKRELINSEELAKQHWNYANHGSDGNRPWHNLSKREQGILITQMQSAINKIEGQKP